MKEETYTEVLCGASEELLHALNDTPQRYIPTNIQGCMMDLRRALESKRAEKMTITSEKIEDEAGELVDELNGISGNMPAYIIRYVRNLHTIIAKRGLAS